MVIENVIDTIISDIIKIEGGYVNNKNDLGGETCWGITREVASNYCYKGEMKDLPVSLAREIYRYKYVVEPGFDKIAKISEVIAAEMIDSGVNVGVRWPCLWLQQTLNLLNKQQTLYPDLTEDGSIGSITLSTLKVALAQRRGVNVEVVILKCLNVLQGARYFEITKARQKNEDFFMGWLNTRVALY